MPSIPAPVTTLAVEIIPQQGLMFGNANGFSKPAPFVNANFANPPRTHVSPPISPPIALHRISPLAMQGQAYAVAAMPVHLAPIASAPAPQLFRNDMYRYQQCQGQMMQTATANPMMVGYPTQQIL